ncbi:MAG: ABC transporter permease subunit [Spirochaetales bacterium]|nr:ABC transporter permease subunit [Spirochaetales bacterium]
MNLNIYVKELKRSRVSLFLWSVTLSGIIFLAMAFYPVLTQNNLLEYVGALFENPMMKSLMSVFGVNIESLTSLLGFYVAYNSIYALLMGSIFSILCAVSILSKEENEKTAEFLLTRPVTRTEVITSKFLAFLTQLVILCLIFLFSGLIALESFKPKDSTFMYLKDNTKKEIASAFEKNPEKFRDSFDLTEDMIIQSMLQDAAGELEKNPDVLEEQNLDMNVIEDLMDRAADDPEGLLASVRQEPEKYMKLFNIPPEEQENFMKELAKTENELAALKEEIRNDPRRYIELFNKDPGMFLQRFRTDEPGFNRFIAEFSLDKKKMHEIFIYYRIDIYLIINLYYFLLMFLMGSIGLLISLLVKRGRTVTGICMGIVFGSYIIDAVSKITPQADFIGYISPFKFVDINVQNPEYMLDWRRVLYFLGISTILVVISFIVYRKKDILL